MCKLLGLSPPKPTLIWLLMEDRMVKNSVGISFYVLVKVDNFIFLDDFVLLDCEVDFVMAIIFGRSFLAMSRALLDMEKEDLYFRLTYIRVVSIINCVDDLGGHFFCYLDED